MATLHVLQLGFVWRHLALLRERDVLVRKAAMSELFLLRLTFAFASTFPLLLAQAFLLLTGASLLWSWVLVAALASSAVSATWALASFRRQHEECPTESIVLTWPGTLFRLLWRGGEIVARVLSLALFASLYRHWMFLVVGLHWLTMLICICSSAFGAIQHMGVTTPQKFFLCVLIAYVYVFCHLNFSPKNSTFRYVLYYVVMFLENATLCVVWILQSDTAATGLSKYLVVFIVACAFFVSMVALCVYYKFFHVRISDIPSDSKHSMCIQDGCINCRLSLCVKHNLHLQRPFSAGWFSQYDKAVYNGHYYKNLLQDSLLDSLSEWDAKSGILDVSQPKLPATGAQDRPGTVSPPSSRRFDGEAPSRDSVQTGAAPELEQRSLVSFQSTGTYSHRRFIDAQNVDPLSDADPEFSCDQDENVPGRTALDDTESSLSSACREPTWMVLQGRRANSRTCLLTDTWDSVLELDKIGEDERSKRMSVVSCRSLMRSDTHHWYSDGYSTDHTLEWSKLPVTRLGRAGMGSGTVYDTESDSVCLCSHRDSRTDSSRAPSLSAIRSNAGQTVLGSCRGQESCQAKAATPYAAPHWQNCDEDQYDPDASDYVPMGIEGFLPPMFAEPSKQKQIFPSHLRESRQPSNQHVYSKVLPRSEREKLKQKQARLQSPEPSLNKNSLPNPPKPQRKPASSSVSHSSKSKHSTSSRDERSDSDAGVRETKQGTLALNPESRTPPKLRATARPSQPSTASTQGVNEKVHSWAQRHKLIDVVYENLAFVSQESLTTPVTPEALTSCKKEKEAPWYVCSESEDSALPQENFSSSNYEGFTDYDLDEASDTSMELVI